MTYSPENLNLWTLPDSYAGAKWPDYYMFLSQHRDSDCLTQSNFICGLNALGGESKTVRVIHEGHWAVGWVEWIGIHKSDSKALEIADGLAAALSDYPVLDENHFSDMEQAEADRVWADCYDAQERIDYIRRFRYQFEFHNFSNLLGCVRGKYFAGYASELIM
jgi:hypothetical protein